MLDTALHAPVGGLIHGVVSAEFTVGDLIEKRRKQRRWNQTTLGEKAADFPLPGRTGRINPNTVSNAENRPYNADFGTIWRLLATLGVSLSEAERAVPNPFATPAREAGETRPAPAGRHRGHRG